MGRHDADSLQCDCAGWSPIVPDDVTTGERIATVLFYAVIWLFLFLVLWWPIQIMSGKGLGKVRSLRAETVSRLSDDALRRSMTFYPGRQDETCECGEVADDGRFPVKTRQKMIMPKTEKIAQAYAQDGVSESGVLETVGYAKIDDTGPDQHEVRHFNDAGEHCAGSRFTFTPLEAGGTHVLYEETRWMTTGEAFGLWVCDFLSDYLTDCVDIAEKQPRRANRGFAHRRLVLDILGALKS